MRGDMSSIQWRKSAKAVNRTEEIHERAINGRIQPQPLLSITFVASDSKLTSIFDLNTVRRTVPSMHDAHAQESLRHAHF